MKERRKKSISRPITSRFSRKLKSQATSRRNENIFIAECAWRVKRTSSLNRTETLSGVRSEWCTNDVINFFQVWVERATLMEVVNLKVECIQKFQKNWKLSNQIRNMWRQSWTQWFRIFGVLCFIINWWCSVDQCENSIAPSFDLLKQIIKFMSC